MSERPLLSVIIPAWNEEKYIACTLSALSDAVARLDGLPRGCEIIVVDNASSDGTAQVAEPFGAHILREDRRGISIARNAGARAARGDLLVFLDADSLPSPNSLVRIRETMLAGDCVGGGVRILPEKWNLRSTVAYGLLPVVSWVLGVSAGMIFAAREDFFAVGGFDERLYAAEDLHFVLALHAHAHKSGKKFANLSDVYVRTSIRKLRNLRLRDLAVFPRYLVNRKVVERMENCALWYDQRYR